MTQTIEDLWNGNIAPADQCGAHDPEINHLVDLMKRNKDALCAEMTANQHKLFEKYMDCSEEYALRMMERAFCDGFCLAGKLMAESLG